MKKYKHDFFILLLLLCLTAIPRLLFLDTVPPGLHNDEAWTGIDARRILQEGFIEPYTASALGQPTGPVYVTALFFRILGDSIFSLRLSMALFGILSIGLFYVLTRFFFDKKISFLTSIAFSFSLIHIHYSRLGFMVISSLLCEILVLIFLALFLKYKRLYFAILTGLFTGVGMLSYNSFILLPPVIFCTFTYLLFKNKSYFYLISLILLIVSFLIGGFPVILFAFSHPQEYLFHHMILSYFAHQPSYSLEGSVKESLKFASGSIYSFFVGRDVDYTDGFGQTYSFSTPYLLLMLIGLVITARRNIYYFLFAILALSAFIIPPSFTLWWGVYRRKILALPILFMLFGFGINFLYSSARHYKKSVYAVCVAIIVLVSLCNLYLYFFKFPNEFRTKEVFTYELVQAAQFIKNNSLPETKVILYSSRNGCGYESFTYIIGSVPCEDRSKEFGKRQYNKQDFKKNTILIFLQNYVYKFEEISRGYPNGKKYQIIDSKTHTLRGIIYTL